MKAHLIKKCPIVGGGVKRKTLIKSSSPILASVKINKLLERMIDYRNPVLEAVV